MHKNKRNGDATVSAAHNQVNDVANSTNEGVESATSIINTEADYPISYW